MSFGMVARLRLFKTRKKAHRRSILKHLVLNLARKSSICTFLFRHFYIGQKVFFTALHTANQLNEIEDLDMNWFQCRWLF